MTTSEIKENLVIKIISDENDKLFHQAYILCYDVFPGMMPYCVFKSETVAVVLLNDVLVGFMVLEKLENINNAFYNILSKQYTKSLESTNSTDSADSADSSNLSELVELISDDENNCDCHIQLLSIGIDKNFRGKNIGFECIEWIKKHYPKTNINLHVSVKNNVAISLYKKCGFVIDSTESFYYNEQGFEPYTEDGRHAYVMTYYFE